MFGLFEMLYKGMDDPTRKNCKILVPKLNIKKSVSITQTNFVK